MGWRRPDNIAGSSAQAIMVGFFVATGGLLFGYDTGTINGILAMDSFLYQFAVGGSVERTPTSTPPPLPVSQQAIIIGMLSIGTVLGSLLAAPTGDHFGRRKSLIASVGVFVFGAIFQICSTNIATLLVGRCVPFCFAALVFSLVLLRLCGSPPIPPILPPSNTL